MAFRTVIYARILRVWLVFHMQNMVLSAGMPPDRAGPDNMRIIGI